MLPKCQRIQLNVIKLRAHTHTRSNEYVLHESGAAYNNKIKIDRRKTADELKIDMQHKTFPCVSSASSLFLHYYYYCFRQYSL